MKVLKRDGREVEFDKNLIENAVYNAALSSNWKPDTALGLGDKIAERVSEALTANSTNEVCVDDIQRLVEEKLMMCRVKGVQDVARSYVEYRHDRDKARELNEDLFRDVNSLINRDGSDILTENANRDSRIIPTIKSLVAESVGKHYTRKYLLPSDIVTAHDSGDIHFHDAGELLYPMFNCMLIDLAYMLEHGFKMGNAEIEQPNSILTACSIAAQVVTAVGSHIYGGNTLPDLDITLTPYVQKTYQKHIEDASQFGVEDVESYAMVMTERDTKAGIQALYYQLNTIISSQGQTVFCTLTCGDGLNWEARLIQKCMLEQQKEGLGKHKLAFVFPKLVFQIRKGVNFYEDDPNYDILKLAVECSAKRLYPDALFMDTLEEKVKTKAKPMGEH